MNLILGDVGSSLSVSLDANLVGAGAVELSGVSNSTPFGANVNSWFSAYASQINLGAFGIAVISGFDGRGPDSCNSNTACDGVGDPGPAVAFQSFSDAPPPIPEVPVPAAVWLFGTALIGFIGVSRRTKVA